MPICECRRICLKRDSQWNLHSLLTDGVIGGLSSVSHFVPQIAILFSFISFLEDTGYMARAPAAAATAIGLGLLCGAAGKSAQFPLFIWLPDAMEGPTPVSALIHAATMVAAGIYWSPSCYFIFLAAPSRWTPSPGPGPTALLAASMALVSYDIKRVLAFSTVSQLGFMMCALGAGATPPDSST